MFVIIFFSCPDQNSAKKLAHELVEKNLAACVNIIPKIESIYKWQGKIEKGKEILLIIKTKQDLYKKVEEFIIKNHPYDCPEIIMLPIKQGSEEYLRWLEDNLCSNIVS